MNKKFTQEEARKIGQGIGVDFFWDYYTRLEKIEKEAEGK